MKTGIPNVLFLTLTCIICLQPCVHADNLAFNKTVTQFGTFRGRGPELAVDGNLSQVLATCASPHNFGSDVDPDQLGQAEWWSVDLASHDPAQRYVIQDLTVYFCSDCGDENLLRTVIYAGEEAGWEQQTECGWIMCINTIQTITCRPDRPVRYLTIRADELSSLYLCEVIVNGHLHQVTSPTPKSTTPTLPVTSLKTTEALPDTSITPTPKTTTTTTTTTTATTTRATTTTAPPVTSVKTTNASLPPLPTPKSTIPALSEFLSKTTHPSLRSFTSSDSVGQFLFYGKPKVCGYGNIVAAIVTVAIILIIVSNVITYIFTRSRMAQLSEEENSPYLYFEDTDTPDVNNDVARQSKNGPVPNFMRDIERINRNRGISRTAEPDTRIYDKHGPENIYQEVSPAYVNHILNDEKNNAGEYLSLPTNQDINFGKVTSTGGLQSNSKIAPEESSI